MRNGSSRPIEILEYGDKTYICNMKNSKFGSGVTNIIKHKVF
jgi:hypothetical protein